MSSFLVYGGITVRCGHCGVNDDKVNVFIWWANQHGCRIRVFCGHCDRMSDYLKLSGKPVQRRLLRSSIHGCSAVLPKAPEYDTWIEVDT